MPEFNWRAIYNDGGVFTADPSSGSKSYDKLDRTRLGAIELFDIETGKLIHRLVLEPGQRLILRHRSWQDLMNDQEKLFEVWLVGWQQTINGKNIQSIAHVFMDGHVENASGWLCFDRENKRVFYHPDNGPELRPDELNE